jgi:hypothetical protein
MGGFEIMHYGGTRLCTLTVATQFILHVPKYAVCAV